MVAALSESLLDDAKRPAFLADAQKVLDAEVSDKGGASGLAVKGGYAAIKKVSPTIVEDALASFAPKFVDALDPFWAEYQSAGAGSFGDLLVAKQDQVAEAARARALVLGPEGVESVHELRGERGQRVLDDGRADLLDRGVTALHGQTGRTALVRHLGVQNLLGVGEESRALGVIEQGFRQCCNHFQVPPDSFSMSEPTQLYAPDEPGTRCRPTTAARAAVAP
nr:hypothetical protein [Nocardia terpenica]